MPPHTAHMHVRPTVTSHEEPSATIEQGVFAALMNRVPGLLESVVLSEHPRRTTPPHLRSKEVGFVEACKKQWLQGKDTGRHRWMLPCCLLERHDVCNRSMPPRPRRHTSSHGPLHLDSACSMRTPPRPSRRIMLGSTQGLAPPTKS